MVPIKVAGMVRNMANSKVVTTAVIVAVLTRSMLLLGSGADYPPLPDASLSAAAETGNGPSVVQESHLGGVTTGLRS